MSHQLTALFEDHSQSFGAKTTNSIKMGAHKAKIPTLTLKKVDRSPCMGGLKKATHTQRSSDFCAAVETDKLGQNARRIGTGEAN